MTEEQIRQKIEQLEQERWKLSMWTDSFNDSERKKYGELCDEISKLEKMLYEKEEIL